MNVENMLSQQVLNQIGKQLGFENGVPEQYVELANTMILGGMSRNVKSSEGASSLYNALKRDHSPKNQLFGSVVSMIPNILGGKKQNRRTNGGGIIQHIFGSQLDPIVASFSKATGLSESKARQLLMIVAPIVMGALAKKVTKNNLSEKELATEVRKEYREPKRTVQSKDDGGLLEQLLDRDKDGSIMDDAAGLLGNLLK